MNVKYLITGMAGLLLIAINLAGYFSRDTNVAYGSYAAGQTSDDNIISQDGCSHDCAACGECFPSQEVKSADELNAPSSYTLVVK